MLLKDFVKLVFSYVYMIREESEECFTRCTSTMSIPLYLMECKVIYASVHNSELYVEVKEERNELV